MHGRKKKRGGGWGAGGAIWLREFITLHYSTLIPMSLPGHVQDVPPHEVAKNKDLSFHQVVGQLPTSDQVSGQRLPALPQHESSDEYAPI